jgi:hypothetical protein
VSESTSSIVMTSRSPFGLVTVHWSGPSTTTFGAFIQFNGL